jgi:Ala-tRNA(Pro) deacylase
MISSKVKQMLDYNQAEYTMILHDPAYTAMETAERAHLPGDEMAKTIIVRLDGKPAMAVIPATHRLDFVLLRAAAKTWDVEFPTEREFSDLFPDCEPGAMPPFGNLYGMEVFVDAALSRGERIAFNAGTHREVIEMAYGDYEWLVRPAVAEISEPLSAAAS